MTKSPKKLPSYIANRRPATQKALLAALARRKIDTPAHALTIYTAEADLDYAVRAFMNPAREAALNEYITRRRVQVAQRPETAALHEEHLRAVEAKQARAAITTSNLSGVAVVEALFRHTEMPSASGKRPNAYQVLRETGVPYRHQHKRRIMKSYGL